MRNTFVALLLLLPLLFGLPDRDRTSRPARTLIVCLDGINFSDFEDLQARGHFPYLQRPSRLIAPFPSLTNPAMVEILQGSGAPSSPGYEDSYFDLASNKMRGGVLKRIGPGFVKGSFRELFDHHPPGFASSLEYLLPPHSCEGIFQADLEAGLKAFRKSKSRVYRIYIGPTDCAAHTGGLNSARGLLEEMDQELQRTRQREPDTHIVLFSDHGNAYGAYRRVDLGKFLKRHGYRVRGRITGPDSAVVPRFGLIGAALVFVHDDRRFEVAQGLSFLEGVHFAATRDEGVVRIYREGHEAQISRASGMLRYQPGEADPLLLDRPRALTPEGWFSHTRDHRYPDPVNRLWEMSEDAVTNRAQVLVGLERGYYAGSPALDFFVELRATHGSLDAEQSLGFMASSAVDLPAYLQTRQAGEFLSAIGF